MEEKHTEQVSVIVMGNERWVEIGHCLDDATLHYYASLSWPGIQLIESGDGKTWYESYRLGKLYRFSSASKAASATEAGDTSTRRPNR